MAKQRGSLQHDALAPRVAFEEGVFGPELRRTLIPSPAPGLRDGLRDSQAADLRDRAVGHRWRDVLLRGRVLDGAVARVRVRVRVRARARVRVA